MTDAGSHKLDILFFVTGLKPLDVFARSQKWGSNVEIITSATALLTDDVTVTMDFIGNAHYLGEDMHIHKPILHPGRARGLVPHRERLLIIDRNTGIQPRTKDFRPCAH